MIKNIAIVSLSRGILGEPFVKWELDLGLKRLNEYGINVKFMPHALSGMDYVQAYPEKRAEDLIAAFRDDNIDMILCAIGGDDTYRLLPYLFENDELKQAVKQKIFLGFSDTTMNHFMLHKLGIKTFYGQAFMPDVCEFSSEMLPYTRHYFEELITTGQISEITPSPVWYEAREIFNESELGKGTPEHTNNGFELLQGSPIFEGKILGGCIDTIFDKLVQLGITKKITSYDLSTTEFQEDTSKLNSMIEQRYKEQHQIISEEKKQSIDVDVRSIIMVYRERKGQVATRIQMSKEIMLTLNGTLANVSKNYESNQSINAGHIPACISADLFGAALWLFSPVEFANYQKKQLLADCYGALRPNKKLLTQYVESLIIARNAGEIDEKKFLFMRSHSVIYDALMNVTRGDYARFNERTYLEVYEEIQERSIQQYTEEVEAHKHTKEMLGQENAQKDLIIEQLSSKVKAFEEAEEQKIRLKSIRWGWVCTICLIGVPYIILLTVLEILKLYYVDATFLGWIAAGVAVVLTIIFAALFEKIKKLLFASVDKRIRLYASKKN